jgi:hypothetical protein
MRALYALLAVAVVSGSACAHADKTLDPTAVQPPANAARPMSEADVQGLAEFNERVTAYAALHAKLEATLPGLPKETTPETIHKHQNALAELIIQSRKGARQGDIITPAAQLNFRQLLARVFQGEEGRQLKASILDENPGNVGLQVNGRYPDQIPLSTVPPQVLAALPKLPRDLEYRFIGDRLILLDVHAHTIADYIDKALPA